MKKFLMIAAILLIMAIGAFAGGFAVRAADLSKFPEGGIYAFRTNSYYGITGSDNNFVISIELFEVRSGLKKRLVDYKDILLIDETGREYASDAKSLTPNYADYALTKTTVRLGFKTEEEGAFPIGITKIRAAKLVGQAKGESKSVSLGTIVVERCESEKDKTKYFSYAAYTQNSETMTAYNINVENVTNGSVRLNGIRFDVAGVQAEVSFLDDYGNFLAHDTYLLAAGESVIVRVRFAGNGSAGGLLNVKFRPLLAAHHKGEDFFVRVPSVTEYVGKADRNEIAAYLKGGRVA